MSKGYGTYLSLFLLYLLF